MSLSNIRKRYDSEENKADFVVVITKCKQGNSDVNKDKVFHQKIGQFKQLQQQTTCTRTSLSPIF